MEIAERAWRAALELPQWLVEPLNFFYGPFLLASAALAFAAWRVAGGRCRAGGFLGFCLPRGVWTHRSTALDARYLVVNATLGAALIAPLLLSSALVAFAVAGLLEALFGASGPALPVSWAARLTLTLALLLAADLAFYANHRLFHAVPALWEFHKVHHSARVLTPLTGQRSHPVEQVAVHAVTGALTGATLGGFDYLFAYELDAQGLLGAGVLSLAVAAVGNLQHSHVWLCFGPQLSRLLMSPAQHQIHHSAAPRHRDRNFGAAFACWDWLAGSLYVPRHRETLVFGLGDGEDGDYDRVWRLYTLPFLRAFRRRAPAALHGARAWCASRGERRWVFES